MPLVSSTQRVSKKDPPIGTLLLVPALRQVSRKSHHHKVRSGCTTCKQRKIKCDETKPECLRCTRAGKICLGYEEIKTWLFEPNNGSTHESSSMSSTVRHSPGNTAGDVPAASQDKRKTEYDTAPDDSSQSVFSIPTWPTFVDTCMPHLNESYAKKTPQPISMLFEFSACSLPSIDAIYQ